MSVNQSVEQTMVEKWDLSTNAVATMYESRHPRLIPAAHSRLKSVKEVDSLITALRFSDEANELFERESLKNSRFSRILAYFKIF